MPRALSWLDRLRIDRAVWTLDLRIADLPGRRRRGIRDEIRTNLRAAAGEVGAARAVRGLGDLRHLAAGYLEAEYGEGRLRPLYSKGAFWAVMVELVVMAVVLAGFSGFMAGIDAAEGHPDGTFAWHGLDALGLTASATYRGGEATGFTFTFTPLVLLYMAVAFVLGGRMWRLRPRWPRWLRRSRPVGPAGSAR